MFRLKGDKLKTFYGFHNTITRNDLNFFKNRMTYQKLNLEMNDNGIIGKNFLSYKLENPYKNSLNNIKDNKKVLSLKNSPQMSLRNIFKEIRTISTHNNKRKEKNIQSERRNKNLFSLKRNNTFSNIKKKFKKTLNNNKIKNTNFSIFDYTNNIYFNKTFYKNKNTDLKNSDNSMKLNLGERSNLYDKFNFEKYSLSDSSNKIKLIKKLKIKNEANIFPHHQKFLSVIKKKKNFFKEILERDLSPYYNMINSSRDNRISSTNLINNETQNNINKNIDNIINNQNINFSNIKFTNSLIRKFINKNKFKTFTINKTLKLNK